MPTGGARWGAALLATALALASVAVLAAGADPAWQACRSSKAAASISGCTAVLARGDAETATDRAVAYYNRANALFNQGKLPDAIADYSRSIDLNPYVPEPHFNRGNAYFNTGDLERAIADYGAVIGIFDKLTSASPLWGRNHKQSGAAPPPAVDQVYIGAYINRGNAHRNRGEFDAAFADYAAALELDPANKLAKGNRAQALAEQAKARPQPAATPETDKVQTAEAKAEPEAGGKLPAAAAGERRIALVIGNSGYAAVPRLPNPQHDAAAIAAALRADGFGEVQLLSDATRADIVKALNDLADKAAGADWAVVYFAGHGLELDGTNYLIPVDARLKSDRDVQDEAVSLDRVISSVEGARKLKLVILDACRNDPFLTDMHMTVASRAIHRGLARVEPAGGTLVAYAAKGGEEAIDGEGGADSPFAAALARRLTMPGLEIGKLFRLVHDDVLAATDRKQEPFVYGALPGEDFFFRPLP
jgi:tetratricopeptide (TPR) repeat protein